MQSNVQWYPGHMFKAKKEIIEQLKNIDLVIEIIDSRVPFSSHNEMLDDLTENKTKLLVFSKSDFVNDHELNKCIEIYEKKGYDCIAANINEQKSRKKLIEKVEQVSSKIKQRYHEKGINKIIKVLVMGMPNVGKSTFINLMAGKKKVLVGNRPGVTKKQQWIGLEEDIELLDTPGILVPKIENPLDGYKLVLCSLIKDEVVHLDDVAVYLLESLFNNYYDELVVRYSKITTKEYDIEQIYNQIAESIGALLPGKEYDYERVSVTLINDYRRQKFGKVMLDEY